MNAVNDAPILSLVGDQSTDEDEDLTISVSASDVDIAENGQSMTFDLTCIDYVDDCNADVCLTLNNGSLNYTSSQDIAGFQFNHSGFVSQRIR